MQLDKAQQSFKDHMFAEVSAVENPQDDFKSLFNVGNISLDTRLKIYRNHIVTTLSNVLVMNFPLVEIITGEDFLRTAAKLYLFDNPPTEACLDRYGETFPDFIDNYEHASTLPYLSEVARLDWMMNEVRTAKDDTTLMAEDLTTIKPELLGTAHFKFKQSVRLIKFSYPLDDIYHFCEEKHEDNSSLDVSKTETYILITRINWEPKVFKLDASEYLMMQCLQEQKTLEKSLEITMSAHPDFNFGEFLQNYIAVEIFSNILANN